MCGRELMAPLAVDPAALDNAGSAVVSAGEGLGSVISTLTTTLAGSVGMAGDDPAGAVFGRSYDRSAAALIHAMSVARNGLCNLGDGVRMTAHNYSLAEAMSDVGGRAVPLPVPPLAGCVAAGSPPSAVGASGGAPPGWGWVAPYIGMIWPNGDSGRLRAAAAAWRSAGTRFAIAEIGSTAGPMGAIRAQQLPEAGLIESAFSDAYASTIAIVGQCQAISAQLDTYAARIDAVHAAILDLLARICDPLTGIKEVWDFLTGEDEDEIRRIAADIAAVIDQFTGEVKALGAEITAVVSQAETVITTMGRHTAKQWDQFLRGNPVGQVINFAGQRLKGIGEAAEGLGETALAYNQIRILVDPLGFNRDAGEMVRGMAPLVGLGGAHAPSVGQAWKELLKDTVHWDDWSKNPGEALGKTEADLATTFLPGGPISKMGSKGRDLLEATRGLKKPPNPLAPHVEPRTATPQLGQEPPAPRTESPEPGRAASAPQPKPALAPASGPLPHSPAESKTPVADKPAAAEPSKPVAPSPASTGQPHVPAPTAPGKHLAATHMQPVEPVHAAAHRSSQPSSAVISAAPHASAPQFRHSAGRPVELPAPHGGPHGVGDGGPAAGHPPGLLPDHGGPQLSGDVGPVGPQDPVHSDELSGDGWHRLADQSVDPHYGEPLARYWDFADNPVDPSRISRGVAELIKDPDAPFGRDLQGRAYSEQEYAERFNDLRPNGDQWMKFPGNDGAVPGTKVAFTDGEQFITSYGARLDRVGNDSGKYLALMENGIPRSWEERALHVNSLTDPYNAYTFAHLPSGWKIEVSEVAPGVGQPGGSIQVRILNTEGRAMTVEDLIELGVLE
ncbi:Outer membrane channel protein CpnT [Mycobacterium simulans]|uniref:Outer membrane channel protein CpnT n=1 Tax=Mycobacterium simulans TaxID=627089 RepID=A0A7Z7NCV6_9MYCO|nr:TNT domain-containing protein [Mycobacterium simulans]SOK27507.1 Outer membrane channel protein CpnT [Mycobacterium simulans]